jgi:hypothetical protein
MTMSRVSARSAWLLIMSCRCCCHQVYKYMWTCMHGIMQLLLLSAVVIGVYIVLKHKIACRSHS